MALFEKVLEASVMSTHLRIRANVSKHVLWQAYQLVIDFEHRYSAYKDASFLNKINQHAGVSALPCTQEDYILFSTAITASEQTSGLFDISIGSLSHGAYHFGFSNQKRASTKSIEREKIFVNYKDILLTENSIFLSKKGMRLDLGGIGKGYVAKQIALFLANAGASKILVDVGGEIVTRGKSYTIALKDPFTEGNIAYIKTSKEDLSISTSGSYERFIDQENHHILDSNKGKSANYYRAMTILQNGWNIDYLDAYATAFFNQDIHQNRQMSKMLNVAMIVIDTHAITSLYQVDQLRVSSIEFKTNVS